MGLKTDARWFTVPVTTRSFNISRDAASLIAVPRRIGLLLARSPLLPRTARWAVLRACGLNVSTRAICSRTTFTGPQVAIGRQSFVNRDCLFDAMAPISIGNGVAVGIGVLFTTSTHEIGPASRRAGTLRAASITVEDGVWIGARAMLLPGVTVGRGCVVAAGAVVAADCAPNGLYAGVPARRIKDLDRAPDWPRMAFLAPAA